MDIGEIKQYLYRGNGEEFPIDATIVGIDGKVITISFTHPSTGKPVTRVLKSARSRSRLIGLPIDKPGAPVGNKNGKKGGTKRIGVRTSLSGERLTLALQHLQKEGRTSTEQELQRLTYQALDAYLEN